jgi:hypothetical protein
MYTDSIQHLDLRDSLDDKPFDHIDAVQFLPLRGDLGEIPAQSWRRPTSRFLAIQDFPSFKDEVDGPYRGERVDLAGLVACRRFLPGPMPGETTALP